MRINKKKYYQKASGVESEHSVSPRAGLWGIQIARLATVGSRRPVLQLHQWWLNRHSAQACDNVPELRILTAAWNPRATKKGRPGLAQAQAQT